MGGAMDAAKVYEALDKARDDMVRDLTDLCKIPAIGPASGGEGEGKKAGALAAMLKGMGLKVEHVDAPDDRVPSGKRPNLIAKVGKGAGRLWLLTHMDVVPPGDRSAWRCDPFDPKVIDRRLYGRGVEDNGQATVATIHALKAVLAVAGETARPVGLCLVSDEESGSEKGARYVLEQGAFAKKDLFLVPDHGVSDGTAIEVAEKNLLWFQVTVRGKQGHGSRPEKAVNAHRAGAYLVTLIDATLHKKFRATDPKFRPSGSTFEPTKRLANVENVNTIPGEDVFCFDCRILPYHRNKLVLEAVEATLRETEEQFGVKCELQVIQEDSSPPTPDDAPIVNQLKKAILAVRGLKARPVGIGGGTVAAPFRKAGFDAAVWETVDETGHTTDEYVRIENLVADAKVFAAMMLG
jgi:succinyl-diaminopimelate desuccinylase